jgi:hypothetical protein
METLLLLIYGTASIPLLRVCAIASVCLIVLNVLCVYMCCVPLASVRGAEEEGTNECKVTVAVFTDPDCPFNLDSPGV